MLETVGGTKGVFAVRPSQPSARGSTSPPPFRHEPGVSAPARPRHAGDIGDHVAARTQERPEVAGRRLVVAVEARRIERKTGTQDGVVQRGDLVQRRTAQLY
jgi:hypothetical protein